MFRGFNSDKYLHTPHPEKMVITFWKHKILVRIIDECHERHIQHLAALQTT